MSDPTVPPSARLSYTLVPAVGDAPATRQVVFLHGIFGSGANWRTFARRLVAERPGWGAVLVDLRMHGTSKDHAPPHTVAACADDLIALEAHLPGRIAAMIGHSFGGKVTLASGAQGGISSTRGCSTRCPGRGRSTPAPRAPCACSTRSSSRAARAVRVARGVHRRDHRRGLHPGDRAVARDEPPPRRRRFPLAVDLAAIRALLEDYLTRDCGPWSSHRRVT